MEAKRLAWRLLLLLVILQAVHQIAAQSNPSGQTGSAAGEEDSRARVTGSTSPSRAPQRQVIPAKRNGTACEGLILLMNCPAGYHINIDFAFFGRDDNTTCLPERTSGNVPVAFNTNHCSAQQSTKFLADKCNGKNNCEAQASVGLFGDSWPCNARTPKYMKVNYTCDQTIYSALLCEAEGHSPLACPAGSRIVTESAFFGRDSYDICHHPTAMLSTTCSADTAFEIFSQLCDGKNRCELDARTEIFGEPCPGTFKYLRVTYTCAACENDHPDDAQCEFWANNGECQSNPKFMIPKCRKACWGCSRDPPECVNARGNDIECEEFAARGECDANPAYMFPYCRKACTRCNELTTCTNRHYNDSECRDWAAQGECGKNALWMHRNCMRACFRCTTDFMECKDQRPIDCPLWKENNQCEENPGFVMTDCFKTCTGCNAAPSCTNRHPFDSDCERWKEEGQCKNNATFMYANCWKTCIGCGGLEGLVNVTQKVWMDININQTYAGRVTFGLLGDRVPKTVANFVGFSQGWNGYTYVRVPFHRVIPGFVVQGGDVWNQDGTGRISIYGARMDDENFLTNHWGKGWVNMANAGPDDNGSQFAILLQDTPWLDGKHVVFAKVLEGMYVLHGIEKVDRDLSNDRPYGTVEVVDAGVVNLTTPIAVEKRPVKEHEVCENFHTNDAECEYWRNIGECKTNALFMTTWCWKACSGCMPPDPAPLCVNAHGNERECGNWAAAGECQTNPHWMIPFCRKSCTFCDRDDLQDMVGNEMLPGTVTSITSGRTFILGQEFPIPARLTHFSAFFVNTNPVYLQVWRDYGDRMEIHYEIMVYPISPQTVQPVLVPECVYVRPGDRIGFTSEFGSSPIAYRFDMNAIGQTTYFRSAFSTDSFDQLGLPYAFSISAFYANNDQCPT